MISKNKKAFVCFTDNKKAFDKVNHKLPITVLQKYVVPTEEIKLVTNMHWSQTAQVRRNSGVSRSLKIEKGVRLRSFTNIFQHVQ